MKILHITAIGFLMPKSGVPAVLKALVEEQNKIPGIEARCASLRSDINEINSIYFDDLRDGNINKYISTFLPDVAIFHSFFYTKFIKFRRILEDYNIPYIIEPHGSFGSMAMRKGWLKKQIAVHTLFRPLIKKSIGYIYTNVAESKDACFHKKNIAVVPNGVYRNIIDSSSIKCNREYPIFYYLGRYDIHHKGLDYLLAALSVLDLRKQEVHINFYGTGSDAEVNFVREGIKRLRYVKALEKGPIYNEEKKKALEEANIMILTSRFEGSPIAILDSLSYGNPCLVTPGTNVADELCDNAIGWKTQLEANFIADTIIRAQKEYQEDTIGYYQRSKAHVLDNYLWSNIAKLAVVEYDKFIKIYKNERRRNSY